MGDESSFLFTGGISVLALIIAFYSVVLGTQRIPNFLTSIYVLIKYSLIYLFVVTLLLLLYKIVLKNVLKLDDDWVFYIQGVFFLVIILSMSYFLLKEYHKVFSMRCYYHPMENITSLFHEKDENTDNDPQYLEDAQIEEFCNNFIPNQKATILDLYRNRTSDSLAIYCEIKNRIELDDILLEMACWALKGGLNLLYLSCRRHPCEFIDLLKKKIEQNHIGQWGNIKKQILLIDAHTNHFGFKEPTYRKKTRMLENENIAIEVANWSYVGIHSAVAHGYERKLKIGDRKDKASLLIYDSCYALSDLESDKLYKIFLKHVIPSERSMGGNITIFAEQWVPDHIRCFAEIAVDVKIDNNNNNNNE